MGEESEVLEILGEPIVDSMDLGDITTYFWRVPVLMKKGEVIHESSVTFNSLQEALNLEVGMKFIR